MFVDKVRIKVKGGKGGNGCISFRRERFLPKGGPNGGDGGNGGNVTIKVDPNRQNLAHLKFKNHFEAEDGLSGSGNCKHGRNGRDLVITVPLGTVIRDSENVSELIADSSDPNSEQILVNGGRGGKGNARYVSSTNQYPRQSQSGRDGEELNLNLELKTIADIGLVGYPNAGKSSFLNVVSNARPKIASYPFTTVIPHLGVVEFEDFFRMTIADIPGIIDGAHQNIGLGHEFLKHIERSKVFAFVLDMGHQNERDPWQDLTFLKEELNHYEPGLSSRPSIILANKMDDEIANERLKTLRSKTDLEICPISATKNLNIQNSLNRLRELVTYLDPSKNMTDAV